MGLHDETPHDTSGHLREFATQVMARY